MQVLQQMMQQQIQLMQPELAQRVKGLSPETKQLLLRIYSQHNRHSDRITLRHVMHEVLADYHSMNAGILTDNPEQAADSARRLANHRIPRGGPLPYLKLDDITDEKLPAPALATNGDQMLGVTAMQWGMAGAYTAAPPGCRHGAHQPRGAGQPAHGGVPRRSGLRLPQSAAQGQRPGQ
jgi:hypothetical protein